MIYLIFILYSLGAGLLQSAYLRAGKGVVHSRRRITYSILAAIATILQVLAALIIIQPAVLGAILVVPIFYVVHRGVMHISLRLRYTFRIGLALVLLTAAPLIQLSRPLLKLPANPPAEPAQPVDSDQ